MCNIYVYWYFKSFWGKNITGCVIQSPHQDLVERSLGLVTDKTKKNKKPRCGCNRALKLTVTHTVRLRFCYFLIFTQTPVQFVKRDIVTAVICCYTTTEFHFAKRDSRCLSFLGFSPCKWWQALVYLSKYLIHPFTHFDEPKNSLELLNPTRNIRICSTKLMTTETETCNVSTLSGWRSTFFSVRNIPFESNASIKQEKFISQWDS